ncbi:MAG TPA: ATP-grasp domain-containing protein [Candidatus Methanoperedens sp.]|nr:ATP-grasp domain-containing protein [Candidatus Methanoperedens sp.]
MNNLENILKDSGYNFFFLVVDKFLDINLPQLPNFQSLFQENLEIKNSGFLLSQKNIQEKINLSPKPVIIPFKPSAKIEHLCHDNKWINASNPASINRLLEDKVKFFKLCQQENLPIVPGIISTFSKDSFLKAQDKFGQNIVVQTHFGWAGNSTHHFDNYESAKNIIPSNTLAKFSPLLDGYSLLNNCCQTRQGLIQSPPALQFTGLSGLTQNPFATVGRQWPSCAPIEVQEKIRQITIDFSKKVLDPLNYRGFFGLDFIVSENQVYLLECNPRLTASFAFYTQIEQNNNLTPLFYYHLAEFVNLDYSIDINMEQNRFYNSNIIGSELTKRNEDGTTIKKTNRFEIFSEQTDPIIINPDILTEFT